MTDGDNNGELKPKQAAWVSAFLKNGFNATRAAAEAGYAQGSARVTGSRLLRDPKVRAVLEDKLEQEGLTPFACKILVGEIALDTDMAQFEPWIEGEKSLEQLKEDGVNTALVRSVRIGANGERSLVLHDRLEAIKEIVRILGLVTKKTQISGRLGRDDSGDTEQFGQACELFIRRLEDKKAEEEKEEWEK